MLVIFARTLNQKIVLRSFGSFQKPIMPLRENQSLSQDFIDILSAFIDEKVEYMLVGGYALGYHGYSRGTGDIDLWVRRSPENAERVYQALKKFGAPLFDVKVEDFLVPDTIFQIGVPPNRIDVITDIDGVSFDEAWPERKTVISEGLNITLIGKQSLLVNKKASGRPKDIPDVIWLEAQTESE